MNIFVCFVPIPMVETEISSISLISFHWFDYDISDTSIMFDSMINSILILLSRYAWKFNGSIKYAMAHTINFSTFQLNLNVENVDF